MTTESNNAPSSVPVTQVSPGSLLRQGREARGMSQQEVAASLNLRVTLVREIEQDKFDSRTATTFTRGYLKAYAKLVGISDEPVVAAYESLVGVDEVEYAEMHSFSRRTRREASEKRLRTVSWILSLLLIGGLFYWYWSQPAEKPAVVKLDASQLPTSSAVATEPAADSAAVTVQNDEDNLPAPQVDEDSAAVVSEPTASEPNPSAAVAVQETPVAAPQSAAVAVAANSAAVASTTSSASSATSAAVDSAAVANGLVITFSGDCWLKVVDANGKVLIEGLRRGGSEARLDGKAPFKLTVGAIKFVSISFMGEAVDTKQFPVGRVARFTLPLKS